MIAGGIVAAFLGVHAEGQSLESLAQPLTAEDDAPSGEGPDGGANQDEPAPAGGGRR